MSADRHVNSFDFLRFVAAMTVLIGHHAVLAGGSETFVPVFQDTAAAVAVCAFFAMSGYLIANSLQNNGSWSRFLAARALRILPNLTLALVVTSAAMLVAYANYSNLEAHIQYVTRNLLMFTNGVTYTIPGVLEDRPLPGPNGSLWTLPNEVWMYAALLLLLSFRRALQIVLVPAVLLGAAVLWCTALPDASTRFINLEFRHLYLGKLATYFFAGATLSLLWPAFRPRPIALAALIAAPLVLATCFADLRLPLVAISASTALVVFGESALASAFSRFGDASYGIYIFAFPVQQLALIYVPNYWGSLVVAAAITVCIGYATWHSFERRALGLKDQLGTFIQSLFRVQ